MSQMSRGCISTLALLLLSIPFGTRQAFAQTAIDPWPDDPYLANNRPPDPRLKADVLVVVAHPDDEVMAAALMAQLVDEGKRVALVWTTRGDGGVNDNGPEQAAAMGDIRETEAMHAAASVGVTNVWDLGGPDTPSQDPLESLETCNHGRCLDRLVRLVRLTRPTVILTWLPVGVTGENHGDHQASGVMATEAFDLAGDPTAYSEQVTPVREPKQNMNRLEGLRPWQPEKIYYFTNPTHTEFFEGQGPQYPTSGMSPSRHMTYAEIAAREFATHLTQGGARVERALVSDSGKALERPIPFSHPTRLILGKSLVPSGVTDDIFTGVVPEGIPYHKAPGYNPPDLAAPCLEIGAPWSYYKAFWQAHGIDHVGKLVPVEVSIPHGGSLNIPLLITNPLDRQIEVQFDAHGPAEWKITPLHSVTVGPHARYFVRLQAAAPTEKLEGWQQFSIAGTADGKDLGTVAMRVELANWALPQ